MTRGSWWLVLLVAVGLAAPAASDNEPQWRGKVDPWVFDQAVSSETKTEFLVVLERQADLEAARGMRDRATRGAWVYQTLSATAEATQGPVLAELRRRELEHQSFWIANMIWVRGSIADAEVLARRPDVARIAANPSVRLEATQQTVVREDQWTPEAIEWGVTKIGAPALWTQGFDGAGIVVGGQDTGYDWDHPALEASYRGWNGVTADHDYSWRDAIHSGGGSCGANAPAPCDDSSHGTHTMGTMVGDDGGPNQIGVAPGARWIGCRNMDEGNGTPATYSECFQFFLAPTEVDGSNPDPALAPHVINNSWGCPASEGCTDPNVLQTVVANTRAAGIIVVASAGNSGSGCASVATPAAIYDEVFSVGSTTSTDAISSFSSRGPVTIDGSNRLKPDITAPGSSIRSSVPGGGYGTSSGTSMAGPHVAGAIAVLLSAAPHLIGDQEAVEECLIASAVPLTSTQICGGLSGSNVPNNTFGHGRLQLVWPLPPACASPEIFADGFESGDMSAWSAQEP